VTGERFKTTTGKGKGKRTLAAEDELQDRVRAEGAAKGWWVPGATIVAAVSGGPDSMALLHLLKAISIREQFAVAAAHLDHRFRGEESAAEARLVRETAELWGIPCDIGAVDLPHYIEETGMNPQAASREKRYAFLREAASRRGARAIMTAHHGDDQAETVLMRIIRGTGVGGLAGIPERRTEGEVELIRPLLRITKRELLEYCERNGVPYAFDSSNAKRHYFRNAVRIDLMPVLEQYNPQVRSSLARLAELASAEHDYMEREARRALGEAAVREGSGWRLERRRLCGFHVALQRRVIKLILNCLVSPWGEADFDRVEAAVAAIAAESPSVVRLDLGRGIQLVREYDSVRLGPSAPRSLPFRYVVARGDNEVRVPEYGAVFHFQRLQQAPARMPDPAVEIVLDEAALAWPLVIRTRQPGDRMRPMGLNGSKKVQDMFVDAKVPRSDRDRYPLLADAANRILWIPGLRRSAHAAIRSADAPAVRVTFAKS